MAEFAENKEISNILFHFIAIMPRAKFGPAGSLRSQPNHLADVQEFIRGDELNPQEQMANKRILSTPLRNAFNSNNPLIPAPREHPEFFSS